MALKKKYIRQASGNLKKAWRLQKGAKRKRRTKTKTASRKSYKKVKKKMSNAVVNIGKMRVYKSDIMQTLGAALSGTVGGLVNQATNGRLTGNAAELAGGVALGFLGGRNGSNLGKGMLMKGAADVIEDNVIPQLFGALGSGSNSSQQLTTSANVF